MGTSEADEPGFSPALRPVVFRAYKITNEWFGKGKKVSELEAYLCKNDKRLFVERIRQKRVVKEVDPNLILHKNDEVVLSGRREFVIGEEDWIGPEVIDAQLLDFPAETLPVMVTHRTFAGETVSKIRADDTKGRTPSWTAISTTVRGRADRPLRTEWNRCSPPAVQVCLAMSKRAARFFQKSICPSGRTTTICVLCSVLAKAFIAWPNTGSDPSMRNCLGSGPPRRLPLPPATMITPVPCCSISVSFRIRGYCP